MQETTEQYIQRLLGYAEGKQPLRVQQATPAKLASLIKGKSRKQLTQPPAPGKWSVAQILAHLSDAEIAISWRLRQMLSKDGVAIQGYDQDLWAVTFEYAKRDPRQSLASFRALRENNVALLQGVPRKLWQNHGVHEERGVETISHFVSMVTGHDINHLQQVEKILKKNR